MVEENKNYQKCKKIKLGLIITSILISVIIIWFALRQTGMIDILGDDVYGGNSISSISPVSSSFTSPLSYSLSDSRYSTIYSSTSY